jgi:MarR family transcriptional regulator for hemolysin
MTRLPRPPVGLHLARMARAIGRAFDAALADAGGSVPTWLIMVSVKSHQLGSQQQLADAVGIRGATLTHHLNALESEGLVERQRDPSNRRVQTVELTPAGDAAFHRMREAAMSFDRRLRRGLTADELDTFTDVLNRLRANVTDG